MAGLAHEWSKNHEVTVLTKVKAVSPEYHFSFRILPKFNLISLFSSVKRADIFIEANISFKTFVIGLLFCKKWFVIHHTTYSSNLSGKFKNLLTLFPFNIACSHFVAKSLKGNSFVIPNFYNSELFKIHSSDRELNSLVFLGRLVSDKGVDLLLEALYVLNQQGAKYQLTIIGIGPEECNLRNLVNRLNLENFVIFKGVLKGKDLVCELNRHNVMVIPSRWKEPFGIVALEGLACGCKIVCPDEGGLIEAAGHTSFLFHHNNLESLRFAIKKAVSYFSTNDFNVKVQAHLNQHTQELIANRYLDYINSSLRG
jgi:glycosyltransferase involved in cell wall biosynthesis